jgi:hypothetical protein
VHDLCANALCGDCEVSCSKGVYAVGIVFVRFAGVHIGICRAVEDDVGARLFYQCDGLFQVRNVDLRMSRQVRTMLL